MRAAGSNGSGQCDVGEWSDVQAVACGYMHAIALTGDGARLYAGSNGYGQQE